LAFIVVFCGCSLKTPPLEEVLRYEQKASALPNVPPIPKKELEREQTLFLEKFFSPWDKLELWGSSKDISWGFETFGGGDKYVGENKKFIDAAHFEEIKHLANIERYGLDLAFAITTKNTNLRIFPTDKPFFRGSEGDFSYPFDALQNSFLSVMQPVKLSHYSTDMAWVFVESSSASGWIKSNEIALIDAEMIQKIKNAPKIVITKDNAPVYFQQGLFAHYLKAGALLPVLVQDKNEFRAFVINTAEDKSGFSANVSVSTQFASWFPLEFNQTNVKTIVDELLNENYGWGGLYANRDCSALTKDFFAIFGVWLPRNSAAQKKSALFFDVSDLAPKAREAKLKELGVPYMTLVYLPGHIMLYTGEKDGKALLLHNIWGIKTKDNGRYIIGKSVITDLFVGENVQEIYVQSLLINRMQGFTIFVSKEAQIKAKLMSIYKESISSIADNVVHFKNGSSLVYDDGEEKSYQELLERSDIQDQFFEDYDKSPLAAEPTNDAGRIRSEEFFKALYGSSKQEVESNLVKVTWLPSSANKTLLFNKRNGAAKALQAVSNELDQLPREYLEFLDNIGGTYLYRTIAGSSKLSPHSFGIAIDINVAKSHYWQWSKDKKYQNLIPQKIIDIFEKHGFIWGGKWYHYDTMHFEYRPELF